MKYSYNNNNNNNLFLRSPPSETSNWCMRPPCLWDKGPPLHSDLTAKVYKGVHTLPPLDLIFCSAGFLVQGKIMV